MVTSEVCVIADTFGVDVIKSIGMTSVDTTKPTRSPARTHDKTTVGGPAGNEGVQDGHDARDDCGQERRGDVMD